MRLTLALLKKRNVTPGYIWGGKHRLTHRVFPWNIESTVKKLKVEEQNMFYLRHPYLTEKQEFGYAKELGKKVKWMDSKKLEKAAFQVKPSVRIEERLNHLLHTNNWEM